MKKHLLNLKLVICVISIVSGYAGSAYAAPNAGGPKQKINQLFKRFVNEKDKISWSCFAQEFVKALPPKQARYTKLRTDLVKLKAATNAQMIGLSLLQYKDLLPPKTQKLFKNYKGVDILRLIETRIKLNSQKHC